jgi:hypothetical protein
MDEGGEATTISEIDGKAIIYFYTFCLQVQIYLGNLTMLLPAGLVLYLQVSSNGSSESQ